MKTRLPETSQRHALFINRICDNIIEVGGDNIAFVILFGSFARGDWVHDYGRRDGYEYASDYDILVIAKSGKQVDKLSYAIDGALDDFKHPEKAHFASVIVDPLKLVNKAVKKGQYFFSDILREGILLYDSGLYELLEPVKIEDLSNEQRLENVRDDYEQWFESASGFLRDSKYALNIKDVKKAAFYLHQATESFFQCNLLVLTGYKPKTHDIKKLNKLCSSQSHQFLPIFPMETAKQKELFRLLRAAYIGARYEKDYKITEEQLDYLIERVEELCDVTKAVCQKKIEELLC